MLGWLGRWVRVRRAKTGTILPYVLALALSLSLSAAASIPLWERPSKRGGGGGGGGGGGSIDHVRRRLPDPQRAPKWHTLR